MRATATGRLAGRRGWPAALLAAIAVAGCADARREPESAGVPLPAQDATSCQALRAAFKQFERQTGQELTDEQRAQIEEYCREGPTYAPATTPQPVGPFRGCDMLPPGDRRRLGLRRDTAEPPKRPVPFFAGSAGTLPRDGRATVAGVSLPRGSRCPHYWATDAPFANAVATAARLAAAFPQTGLWPVLWPSFDDPDSYLEGVGDPRTAAKIDPEETLSRTWSQYGDGSPFPRLAPASEGEPTGPAAADPFGTTAQAMRNGEQPQNEFIVLLVPCHRPADAVSVLGWTLTEVMNQDEVTAVLRSWEERFGAVLTVVGFSDLGLAVGAPVSSRDQAMRVAAEQFAFAPEDDLNYGTPNGPALPQVAHLLLEGEPNADLRSRDFWRFWYPD